MKKITLLSLLFTITLTWSYAQCVPTAAPIITQIEIADMATEVAIDRSGAQPAIGPFSWTEDTVNPASSFNVSFGNNTAGDDIGTLTNAVNGNSITFGGWTANTTYYWKVEAINCFGSSISTVRSFTTSNCTATAAPIITQIEIADMAIDIPIDRSGAQPAIGPFSWTEDTVNPASSFNVSFGNNTAGDDIGTLTNAVNGNSITFGGWTANTTYYWKVEAINCFGSSISTVRSFTTSDCTATAAPIITQIEIADMAIDIPIDRSQTTPEIGPFSWTVDSTNPATSYDVSFGNTSSGDDIGTLTNATNGSTISFGGWDDETTYYWKVTAINCFGSTTSTIWSFKTAPSLSISEFNNTNKFSIYPNPAKNNINIKSDSTFDSVEIYNQLGQRVMEVNYDVLIDNSININNLNSGLYFIKIKAEEKQQTIKFIKK